MNDDLARDIVLPIASVEDIDPRSVTNQPAIATEDARMRAARPKSELRLQLAVDPRRTYDGAEVAALLDGAVVLLTGARPLESLPDGFEVRGLVRTVIRRPTSAAYDSSEGQADRAALRDALDGRR